MVRAFKDACWQVDLNFDDVRSSHDRETTRKKGLVILLTQSYGLIVLLDSAERGWEMCT
jgi:hypothetical protein